MIINLGKNWMSVSTNLRTDTSMMYEYSAKCNQLNPNVIPSNVDIFLDNIPNQHPHVARICPEQGYILIWHADAKDYPTIAENAFRCKNEPQNVNCNDANRIEIGMAIVYPYDDEVILGTVKYFGYVYRLGRSETTSITKQVWKDIILMFGDRKIICPSGSYLEWLHLSMNQERIPTLTYKRQILKPLGFMRQQNYWIRDANILA
jgi:hypothetical protein